MPGDPGQLLRLRRVVHRVACCAVGDHQEDLARSAAKLLVVVRIRREDLGERIVVHDVALTNFVLSQAFSQSIELKQIEEQNVQRAEFLRQQAVKEAERQVALAEGQAKANTLIRQSLTSDLIQFEALKKWDGKLPTVTGGAMPFVSVAPPEP